MTAPIIAPQLYAGCARWLSFALCLAVGGCGGGSTDDGTPDASTIGTVAEEGTEPSDISVNPMTPTPAPVTTPIETPPADDPGPADAVNDPMDVEPVPVEPAPADPVDQSSTPIAQAPSSNADGGPTDCGETLPCTWRSADGGLTILLTQLDGTQVDSSGSLIASFSVTSTRNTEVSLLRSSSTTVGGMLVNVARVSLGGVNGTSSATVSFDPSEGGTPDAGLTLNGSVRFRGSLQEGVDVADNVVLELLDSGTETRAVFRRVPQGREATPDVDCANALPCSWTSKDGDVRVDLESFVTLTNSSFSSRPELRFVMTSRRTLATVLGGGTNMVTDGGTSSRARRLVLGGDTASIFTSTSTSVTTRVEADLPTNGSVIFRENIQIQDTQARRLLLNLFEDRSLRVPRWNPVFRNVPIAS